MIKKYNQFVKNKLNENQEDFIDDINPGFDEEEEGDFTTQEVNPGFDEEEGDSMLGEEEEEEGGDLFKEKLKKLAKLLGTEVTNNEINYNGERIIFPSETEMFHVGKKKLKTAEEAYEYLQVRNKREDLRESKSYRNSRRNK